jgi:hypothetical protein
VVAAGYPKLPPNIMPSEHNVGSSVDCQRTQVGETN